MTNNKLRDLFTPSEKAFQGLLQAHQTALFQSNSMLSLIIRQLMRNYYSTGARIQFYPVNEERFVLRLSYDFQDVAQPNKMRPSEDMIKRFLNHLAPVIQNMDIYTSEDPNGYPLLSYRPEELRIALRQFIREMNLPEISQYDRMIAIAEGLSVVHDVRKHSFH